MEALSGSAEVAGLIHIQVLKAVSITLHLAMCLPICYIAHHQSLKSTISLSDVVTDISGN